jgi:hypothetical protein
VNRWRNVADDGSPLWVVPRQTAVKLWWRVKLDYSPSFLQIAARDMSLLVGRSLLRTGRLPSRTLRRSLICSVALRMMQRGAL